MCWTSFADTLPSTAPSYGARRHTGGSLTAVTRRRCSNPAVPIETTWPSLAIAKRPRPSPCVRCSCVAGGEARYVVSEAAVLSRALRFRWWGAPSTSTGARGTSRRQTTSPTMGACSTLRRRFSPISRGSARSPHRVPARLDELPAARAVDPVGCSERLSHTRSATWRRYRVLRRANQRGAQARPVARY